MRFIEIIKRFAPFLVTFSLGLLVASFFVSVAAPKFTFKRGMKKHHECKLFKSENERLQERVRVLERRNRQLENERMEINDDAMIFEVIPPPPAPPAPPVAPQRTR